MTRLTSGGERQVIEEGTLSMRVGGNGSGSERVIEVSGELDAACVGAFRAQIQRERAAGAGGVIVDLGGLEFIDSIGVEAIYRAAEEARQDGGGFALRRGAPAVERTFELMGLDGSLPFVD